jgi:WD40 repeat protein
VWDLHPIRPDRWSPNFLILEGNRGIKTIAFSPDGQLIVSAAKATPVKIWSLAGEMIHQLKDTNYACMLAFCSGGKHLAVINLHGKAQVWDVAAGEQLWELELGEITGGMNTVAVSYRGDIAWIDKNGFLRVCDLKGRRREYLSTSSAAFLRDLDNEINNQEKDAISVTAISFSPNGTLAAGTSNGLLMLCELWTGSMTYKVQVHSGKVRHLSFASTGEIMTSGGGDKLVCIWTLSGKKLNCRFRKAVSPFRVVSTPDGLLVWSSGLILKLWDTYTDEQAEDLIGHRNAILDIAFSSRGDLASASQDGTIRLWQIPSCKEPAQKDNLEMTAVNSCAFNHCGDQLVSGHSHGEIRLWNVHTGKLLWSTNEHRKIILGKALFSHKIIGIPAIAFSSDGRFIVSGTTDGAVELWDAQNGDNLRILQYSEDSLIHIQQVAAVAFSPDGERIASGQIDGSVLLWQLRETGVSILHESSWETEGVVALAFSLDGNYIVFATDKGKIGIWDTRTCEILHTFTCSAKSIVAVAIDSNKLVAIGSSHGWPLQVWDGESGALLKELFPNDNATPPTRLEFSDGRILHTPAGTFTFTETHALEEVTFRTAPLRVNSSGDWIQWNGINLLWLPPEYRVSGTHFGILHGETIAVPTTTKGMAFYRLKPNLRAEDFEPKFSSLPPSTARSSRVSLGVM